MSKVKKSNKKHTKHNLADVTINDYANSTSCKNRIKKWTCNVDTVVQKEIADERSWDEKIDEYDGNFVEKINEDGSVSYVIQKIEPRKRKTAKEDCRETEGNVYHIDIWFLISEYIKPEDVGRFAGICKTSYEVICTEKFWYSLYKKYYRDIPNLPEHLRPNNLLRRYSLRTSVIRALYFLYKPFINRVHLLRSFKHPDILRKTQCISIWHRKNKCHWIYYFKMKVPNYHKSKTHQPQDIFELLDDLSANQEEDCRILEISCEYLIPITPVLGLMLTSTELNLSSGLSSYKLKLWFGSEIQSINSSTGGNGSTLIIFEPVINVRVLDWWHPLYPHSCSMVEFNQE